MDMAVRMWLHWRGFLAMWTWISLRGSCGTSALGKWSGEPVGAVPPLVAFKFPYVTAAAITALLCLSSVLPMLGFYVLLCTAKAAASGVFKFNRNVQVSESTVQAAEGEEQAIDLSSSMPMNHNNDQRVKTSLKMLHGGVSPSALTKVVNIRTKQKGYCFLTNPSLTVSLEDGLGEKLGNR
ncbi:hypothetical protein STEG23_024483, partial [Scotinomys teguina]